MSELPGAVKERDELLDKERAETRAHHRAQAELWRKLQESAEWKYLQEIVKANREEALKTLLNLECVVENYGFAVAHLQGYIRAMDCILGLPQAAIDKGK